MSYICYSIYSIYTVVESRVSHFWKLFTIIYRISLSLKPITTILCSYLTRRLFIFFFFCLSGIYAGIHKVIKWISNYIRNITLLSQIFVILPASNQFRSCIKHGGINTLNPNRALYCVLMKVPLKSYLKVTFVIESNLCINYFNFDNIIMIITLL